MAYVRACFTTNFSEIRGKVSVMHPIIIAGSAIAALCCLAYLYIYINDRKLMELPREALAFSPDRFTDQEVKDTFERISTNPIDVREALGERTGRRYIVVGGAGFLGGWIVVHLLLRGEDPKKIRVLDIRTPTRADLTIGKAKDIDFRVVDVSDALAVKAAFEAPWPQPESDADEPELTVFHTAANIRFYERMMSLVPYSAKVNIFGTKNVLDAARSVGATALVYTSSGSICVRRSRFWLWPWEKAPAFFVQAINDDDAIVPKQHDQFFSNYAYTKSIAERVVRDADKTASGPNGKILHTGCLRPGNGIYGPGGDILCGAYIIRQLNPTWIPHVLQNFIYVENCSIAHLCYERRLIELSPDVGGQAFCIADPGPPPTYGDVYHALNVLTEGRTTFPVLSPSFMLLIAHVFEIMYLGRHYLSRLRAPFAYISKLVPPLGGDLVNLQPSMFALVMVHLIFDDSRARLPPSKGGLGYSGRWTTLEGLCKLVHEHEKNGGKAEARQLTGGGVSFGFGLIKAERGVGKVASQVSAEKALN